MSNFFIQIPNGKTISAMVHPDPRSFVQKIFQDFDPSSGVVKNKGIVPFDCEAGSPQEQGVPIEARRGRIQLWLNYNGSSSIAIPVPGADGKTNTILLPLEEVEEFANILKNLQANLKKIVGPKKEG